MLFCHFQKQMKQNLHEKEASIEHEKQTQNRQNYLVNVIAEITAGL